MKVIATKAAFYNGRRVREGEELDVPNGLKGSWFVTAAEPVKAPPKATRPEPRALSQAGKDETKSFIQAHADKSDLA